MANITSNPHAPPISNTGEILGHIKVLDGVRAISIISVILAHTAPLGPKAWQFNSMFGVMGMSLFFCLSGFLIVLQLYRNGDAISFLVRRILRIVPPLALYVLLMVVLFGISARAVGENLLFVTNYFSEGRGRGSVAAPMTHLWSLSIEMHFYLFMGLAAFVLKRHAIWLVPFGAVMITGLRVQAGIPLNIATHLRADEILAGGTLALVALYVGPAVTRALDSTARALLVLGVFTLLWLISCHPEGGALMYMRPYLGAILVGILIHSRIALLHPLLEGRIASYIAKISYALYIYHPLTIWGTMNTGTDVERYLIKRPVSYVLTLVLAHASTFWWEAPWQTLARRLAANRTKV